MSEKSQLHKTRMRCWPQAMKPEDIYLQMRVCHTRKVPDNACMLLNKRVDKLRGMFGRGLKGGGGTCDQVGGLSTHGDHETRYTLVPEEEIEPFGPSHKTSGENVRGDRGGVQ